MLIIIWLGVAAAIGFVARKAGPWWRVSLGSVAWPALPLVVAISRYRYVRRRRIAR